MSENPPAASTPLITEPFDDHLVPTSETQRLSCEDVFRRLDDYLDRELSDAEMEWVAEHLESCAPCAQEHRFESRLLEQIKQKLGQLKVPDLLVKRIAKLLDQERLRGS